MKNNNQVIKPVILSNGADYMMTPEARESRKAYKREWAKKNPDKIRQYQETYWEKKAQEAAAENTESTTEEGEQNN